MLRNKSIALYLAILFFVLFAIAGSLISLHRLWQYEVFYFDSGLFDKAIWSVSRFSLPIIDHKDLGETIIFADHFGPSMFLLSPFLWIAPFNETLFVIQASAVALGGLVLFFIARQILRNDYYALCLQLVYFLFVGIQNAIITDFHDVTVATLFFMLVFWAILNQKKKWFFVFFIILLGFKESLFLLGIALSVIIYFTQPRWRRIAVITFIISVVWGVVAIKGIIPFFSGGRYLYGTEMPSSLQDIVFSYFDHPTKRDTLFNTYLSFGFLSAINPIFWLLQAQDFFVRFYPEQWVSRWGLTFHYSALTGAIMAVSSIYGVLFLQKRVKSKYVSILLILVLLNSLYLYRFKLRGPFGLAYNGAFYRHTQNFKFLDKAVAQIPKDASIMTQNNLAIHFTHQQVWLLQSDRTTQAGEYYRSKKPDYVLLDLREGQNPNNHWGISEVPVLVETLSRDPEYKLVYDEGRQLIFKRQK